MLGAILGGLGSVASSLLGKSAADKQADLQKDFAQKGIQWKVKDAKAAGIHPLYALGANTVSYSPVSVGQPDLGAMGADIGQAIDRVSTAPEKAQGALGALALERAGLENDLLRAQIQRARINTAGQVAGPILAPTTNQQMTEHPDWVVGNPELGQRSEDAYGEVGGSLIGALGLLRDLTRAVGNRYYKPGPNVIKGYGGPYVRGWGGPPRRVR